MATKEEIAKIINFIKEDIEKHGVVGLYFGIEYSPGISFEEIIEISSSIKEYDVLLSAHYDSVKLL